MTTPSAPLRILVVDDEPAIRRFLRTSLTAQGYQIIEAETAKAALESLRNRVAQAERESTSLWLIDSNVRQQLSSQVQLMRELLSLAEQQQSDRGKSPTVLAVERRLNQLQGQTMCEACHSGIVAQNHGVGTYAAQ